MVQNLLVAGGMIAARTDCWTDLVRHQQLIGPGQFFRQQPIKLIFETQGPGPVPRPPSHVLSRGEA
jgi:hypothetical protein